MPAETIREKLDGFIRKYYLNQLIRGALLACTLLLAAFLFVNITEYYAHLPSAGRAMLFWSFVLSSLYVLIRWIGIPLLKLSRLGSIISYKEAAKIIGLHFSEVQDKLINLLQLEEMAIQVPDNSLLLASVQQKTDQLKAVPFASAINLAANKKYLRYLAMPLLMLGLILIFQSSMLSDGAERLLHYNKQFKKKAPFSFVLLNKDLATDRGSDVEIQVKIEGKSIPESVDVVVRGQSIKMMSANASKHIYTLKNVNEDELFFFRAAGFESEAYTLKVSPKPALLGVEAFVVYPGYTGKKSEYINNTSDFNVPEGTEIQWNFKAKDVQTVLLQTAGKSESLDVSNTGHTLVKKRFFSDAIYRVLFQNKNSNKVDSARYSVLVVPDRAPGIFAEKREDSANVKQFFFLGNASDDYGLRSVNFTYRFTSSEIEEKVQMKPRSVALNLDGKSNDASFYYVLNMDALGIAPSDEIEYYFEAWDNDGIHGSKSSRTPTQTLRRQSLDEVRQNADATAGKVKNMISEAMKQAKELQKSGQDMQDKLNRQKNMNWDDKTRVQDLLNKQKEFEKKLEEIKKEQDKLQQQEKEFQKKNEELEKKQQDLNSLFKKMEDPELKKLMEEIQKLLEKQGSKEDVIKKLDELQQKNTDWSKEMDKLKEQFKELQLEQKMQDNIEQLNNLAEKQEKLADKTQNAKSDENGELKKKQDELNKAFDQLKEDIKEAEKLNKELEKPMDLDVGEEEQKKADENMDAASKDLDNNKNKKASENQKSAAEQMKKAAQKMKDKLDSEKNKRTAEDYQKIRQLLENLVQTSFTQEAIFTELATLRNYNPRFVELNRKQMSVKEDCAMLEDSLRALAKRQPAISTFITQEIARINTNMTYALDALKVRQFQEAASREQFVMTGLNNLSNMLLESMDKMQQQMSKDKKQGNQSCSNPNKSGKSGKMKKGQKLSSGQEELGKMLQSLQKKAQEQREGQDGKDGKPKDGKPKDGKEGQREMNKNYAQIALMQEALRRQLNDLKNNLDKNSPEGKKAADELKQIEELMQQQERDLVNKKISPEMIRRQEEIKTRLLEHEKSERNQQTEDKREAGIPPDYKSTLPPQLEKYLKEKQREREMLRKTPPELSPYFREKSREYLHTVK